MVTLVLVHLLLSLSAGRFDSGRDCPKFPKEKGIFVAAKNGWLRLKRFSASPSGCDGELPSFFIERSGPVGLNRLRLPNGFGLTWFRLPKRFGLNQKYNSNCLHARLLEMSSPCVQVRISHQL